MYPLMNFFTEFLQFGSYNCFTDFSEFWSDRLRFYVSKVSLLQMYNKCTLSDRQMPPRSTCIPGWEPLLLNLFIRLHNAWAWNAKCLYEFEM